MKTDKGPLAPRSLGAIGKRFWRDTVAEFEFEPHHLRILEQAARTLDRLEVCRLDIKKNGTLTRDRFDQAIVSPAVELEIKLTRSFKSLVRELQLDIEPKDAGYSRPPRLAITGRNSKHA